MRLQSQPIHVLDGDKDHLVFGLRLNLNRQQADRLIVSEVKAHLEGYECDVDWPNKRLRITRVNQAKRSKPARSRKPTQATGTTDSHPI